MSLSRRPVRIGILCIALLTLVGCRPGDEVEIQPPPDTDERRHLSVEVPRPLHFTCADGDAFTAEFVDDVVRLELPDTTVTLSPVAGSEGQYRAAGYEFALDGAEAVLLTSRGRWSCRSFETDPAIWQDARARGVTFRAIGQEPGWLLEIFESDSLVLDASYGQERHVVSDFELETDDTGVESIYRGTADETAIEVVILADPCEDVMSGELFEATVRVSMNGEEYRGCGRPLG